MADQRGGEQLGQVVKWLTPSDGISQYVMISEIFTVAAVVQVQIEVDKHAILFQVGGRTAAAAKKDKTM